MSILREKLVKQILFGIVFMLIGILMTNKLSGIREMAPQFLAPYLSAAENLPFSGSFLIDYDQCIAYEKLHPAEREDFKFSRSDNLKPYYYNEIGYVYMVKAAITLFPLQSYTKAIAYFQVSVHLLFSLLLLYGLWNQKVYFWFFLLGYCLNPFILIFVSSNYYFWLSIPSFILLYLLLIPRFRNLSLFLFAFVIPFLLATRISLILVVFVIVGLLFRYFKHSMKFYSGLIIFLTLFFSIYKGNQKQIWHTAYIGIAAYPNSEVDTMCDETGLEYYNDLNETQVSGSLTSKLYQKQTLLDYNDDLKKEYVSIFKRKPSILLKNFLLNFTQLYAGGHIIRLPLFIKYLMSFLGLSYALYLAFKRETMLILLIAAPSLTFIWFYPPIAVYMFGSYLFLVLSFAKITESIWVNKADLS